MSLWTLSLQERISILCCVAMVVGLLFSRGVLSIAMIIMLVNALHPEKIRDTWRLFVRSPFALCCIFFFLSYFISGLWSSNTDDWISAVQVKIPFLFLPFAILNAPFLTGG